MPILLTWTVNHMPTFRKRFEDNTNLTLSTYATARRVVFSRQLSNGLWAYLWIRRYKLDDPIFTHQFEVVMAVGPRRVCRSWHKKLRANPRLRTVPDIGNIAEHRHMGSGSMEALIWAVDCLLSMQSALKRRDIIIITALDQRRMRVYKRLTLRNNIDAVALIDNQIEICNPHYWGAEG